MERACSQAYDRRDWNMKDIATVRNLYTEGWLKSHELAVVLQRSHGSVRQFIFRNPQLKKHNEPGKKRRKATASIGTENLIKPEIHARMVATKCQQKATSLTH